MRTEPGQKQEEQARTIFFIEFVSKIVGAGEVDVFMVAAV